MIASADFPFLLDNPRAWRTYLGGRMLDALHDQPGKIDHFPEEWILSTVAARNAGRGAVSRRRDEPPLWQRH